ncbi:MAG: hypothetical protein PHI72_06240 [Atribacterota bacterium]|nr:hypothetical protein [Atribacterota bacterium]MDD4896980.1 hypothetical protein [Atribacterota bacterium]MDD5636696.1 hypothetical protein [Atribacterota bacterium]
MIWISLSIITILKERIRVTVKGKVTYQKFLDGKCKLTLLEPG